MAIGGRPDKQRRMRGRRDASLDHRIDEIQHAHGLDRAQATQIALGRADLNDVLQRMAINAQVDGLIRRYDLSRALATQIALGQADLEAVLLKRRMSEHLAENRSRSILDAAAADQNPLVIGLHGKRVLEGKVVESRQYEIDFKPHGEDAETVHKLQLKYAMAAGLRKKARRVLRYDRDLSAEPREPIWKPQDRYTCSNRRLYGYMDKATAITVTLLEGEQFKGKVTWIGRFEFGFEVKTATELVIFRHALADVTEG
ncbi:MAG: hypothetical protein H6739_04095 [Alphaproteobacteria bacterium]|nr:hypothetical protein [Alphaproteobacteria bacterium]